MKKNKNVIYIALGFILFGFNLGIINYEDLSNQTNLADYCGAIAAFFILLSQFKILKNKGRA